MFYYDLLRELYEDQIQYLIVGGLAVNLYGIPRVTQDIDIIISMAESNIEKLINLLKRLDYLPHLPINPRDLMNPTHVDEWINTRNLKALSFNHKIDQYKGIDIVLIHPLDFDEAYQNKTIKSVKNIKIYLVSLDNLIKMKTVSGRNQDQSDVHLIKKLKEYLKEKDK